MKEHLLGSEVIFSKESNIVKIIKTSNILLKLILVYYRVLYLGHYCTGNDFDLASKLHKSIVFADDTNLFISNRNIWKLFQQINNEILLLKTYHTHKISATIDWWINSIRRNSQYFFGVLFVVNVIWKTHL